MLIYRLESKSSALCVRLEEQGMRRILYFDTLKAKATAKDLPVIQFLSKLHLRANPGKASDTLSFQEILLHPDASNEAIRLMADTGRLYFAGTVISVEPRKARIFWNGELHSERSATLQPFLQLGIEEVPLANLDFLFLGKMAWALLKGKWFEIENALPWKWIEFFRKGPAVLEGVEKKRFLEDSPDIRWNRKREAAPPASSLSYAHFLRCERLVCQSLDGISRCWQGGL